MHTLYDVVIIGAGSAGSSAAIYATRYNLKTLLISGPMPGGLITEAIDVENYPGFTSINGMELANRFLDQAKALGAEYLTDIIENIEKVDNHFHIIGQLNTYEAKSVILAMGTSHKKLGIDGEQEFAGRGVSYCSTCDGPFFKNKIVAVVGGGNSAVEGAQDLAMHAQKVYLIYRSTLRAVPVYIDNMRKNLKIIEISNTNVLKIIGSNVVENLLLDKEYQNSTGLSVDGVFIQIGYDPQNALAQKLGLQISQHGYVKVDLSMSTTLPGVFCAGDLNNASNMLHQQVTSAAEGAVAAQSCYRYLHGINHLVTEI